MVSERQVFTLAQVRKLYGPYWKAHQTEVSDTAIELALRLSSESISGLEGADIISLTPILDEAIKAERKRFVGIVERCIPMGLHNSPSEYQQVAKGKIIAAINQDTQTEV